MRAFPTTHYLQPVGPLNLGRAQYSRVKRCLILFVEPMDSYHWRPEHTTLYVGGPIGERATSNSPPFAIECNAIGYNTLD